MSQHDRWAIYCPDGKIRAANRGGMSDGSWYQENMARDVVRLRNLNSDPCCGLKGEHGLLKRKGASGSGSPGKEKRGD